ncbi:unnamed protein product [Sympodiomycopsis kandeliae]
MQQQYQHRQPSIGVNGSINGNSSSTHKSSPATGVQQSQTVNGKASAHHYTSQTASSSSPAASSSSKPTAGSVAPSASSSNGNGSHQAPSPASVPGTKAHLSPPSSATPIRSAPQPSTSSSHVFAIPTPPASASAPTPASTSSAALSQKAQGKARQIDADLPNQGSYIPPSRLFSSPTLPQTGSDGGQVPLEKLSAELNQEDDAYIPLAAILERVSSEAYDTLQNLGETISSLDSSTRRNRIFNTALDLRRQMIKLYVLTKWSKGSKHMGHLKNILGLVHEQSYQTIDARDHLTETRGILPNARERNHDLITAIDVLSSGEPHASIPRSIAHSESLPPKKLTDADVREIIEELDRAIRIRLACSEPLPLPFQNSSYQVSEGRLHLHARNLFKITLTLSGAQEDDRWYLLSIEFDYQITGTGEKTFPKDLWDGQREGFVATANDILAPVALVGEQELVGDGDEQMGVSAAPRPRVDAPIVRLYDFLASQALEYQLDILAYQAAALSRRLGRDTVSWHWEERCLVVKYWTQTNAAGSNARRKWHPLQGGTIKLQVKTDEESRAAERLIRSLNDVVEDEKADDAKEKKLRLERAWEVDDQLFVGKDQSAHCPKVTLINAQDLNFETLLEDLTAQHASLAMSVLEQQIMSSSLGSTISSFHEGMRKEKTATSATLVFALHETLTVVLKLDSTRGKLTLASDARHSGTEHVDSHTLPAANLSSSTLTSSLRQATTSLNSSPDSLLSILTRLQVTAVREDLQNKASLIGIPSLARLNLNQEEYTKFGPQSSASQLVYLPLQQSSSWYLFLTIKQDKVSAGVLCAMPLQYGTGSSAMGNAGPSLAIQSLQWIELNQLLHFSSDLHSSRKRKRGVDQGKIGDSSCKSITADELARLYSYTTALTLTAQLEGQLRMRGLRFLYVPPSASSSTSPEIQRAEDAVPSMTLRTHNLFGSSASSEMLCTNSLLKLKEYWNPSTSYVRLVCKLKSSLASSLKVNNQNRFVRLSDDNGRRKDQNLLGNDVTLDLKRSTLTFEKRNVGQALDTFALEWQSIAKVLSLAYRLSRLDPTEHRKKLLEVDLRSVKFAYGSKSRNGYDCQMKWQSQSPLPDNLVVPSPSAYILSFNKESPHRLIEQSLQSQLNNAPLSSVPTWASFLALLDQTLPLLELLSPVYESATESIYNPDVVIKSPTWYQVIWMEKWKLDIRLIKGGSAFVFYDGSVGLFSRATEDTDGMQDGNAEPTVPPSTASPPKSSPVSKPVIPIDETDSYLNLDDDNVNDADDAALSTTIESKQDKDSQSTSSILLKALQNESDTIPNLSTIFHQVTSELLDVDNIAQSTKSILCFDEAILCSTRDAEMEKKLLQNVLDKITKQFSP